LLLAASSNFAANIVLLLVSGEEKNNGARERLEAKRLTPERSKLAAMFLKLATFATFAS
jgi:hypothetical protein